MTRWHANGWQRRSDLTSKASTDKDTSCFTEQSKAENNSAEKSKAGPLLLPVANLDLWKRVWSCTHELEDNGTRLELVWTKGHASDVGNNAADRLASAAIR